MKLNLRKLITFLDDPSQGDNRHASAITGVIGEDLNAGAFAHYLESGGTHTTTTLPDSPLPGTKKGQRLDRWIHAVDHGEKGEILYQCEIKNWAASAIGGKKLSVDCTEEELKAVTQHYWEHQVRTVFKSAKQPNGVTKVLLPMKVPSQYSHAELQPLIIYWMPILNPKENNQRPYFAVSLKDLGVPESFSSPFTYLNFFSVSLYLRDLLKRGVETLDLTMPNAERRATILTEIQGWD